MRRFNTSYSSERLLVFSSVSSGSFFYKYFWWFWWRISKNAVFFCKKNKLHIFHKSWVWQHHLARLHTNYVKCFLSAFSSFLLKKSKNFRNTFSWQKCFIFASSLQFAFHLFYLCLFIFYIFVYVCKWLLLLLQLLLLLLLCAPSFPINTW